MSVISGHMIFTGFRKLTGCQRDPRDRGVTYMNFSYMKLMICHELNYSLNKGLGSQKGLTFQKVGSLLYIKVVGVFQRGCLKKVIESQVFLPSSFCQ